ncbi:zinc ribbon domain-containing protein [Mycolicibacterium sp.]|uniref:zinc ribbon domain-containing protein n=1 Tax=Mycolicibacterium sp. TaxID=2320850 RepID=UPI001A1CBBF5|nr:zinc ribbon domain-containing protein [Mycolicibacterium sp.]MBJ7340897.1 zinc ribbon domain-containing protein [Mycolicibacterium sp.]
MTCRICDDTVPADEFCGNCGATASPRRGDGPPWLRLSTYAAAPREHVLSPRVTSTLFPALSRRSRIAFGLALIVLVALMVGTALPMWEAALIGLVGFGLPLLFIAYLEETGALAELSIGALATTAVLGIAFGIGWGLATDAAAARAADDALGLPVSPLKLLVTGLAIPLGFLILLLAPVVIVRLWRPGTRKSLSGFIFGSFGALCFVSAGTLTRLAPELATGPVGVEGRSAVDLVVAGLIQGIAIPLTAAAVGGAVGATLWFVPRSDAGRRPSWFALSSPVPALTFGIAAYLGLGVLDLFTPPDLVEAVVYALLAVLALYMLRITVHSTLLREEPDVERSGEPAACPQCEQDVPRLPFCPRCGAARRAGVMRSTSIARLLLIVTTSAAVVAAASVAVSTWLTPPKALVVCPPDCGQPPISHPVATNPRFISSDGEFSVSYPGPQTAYDATFEPSGVVLDLLAGDGGTLRLFGQPADGQSPKQIANDLLKEHYPDATFDYEIPNAFVGYQLGYGEVADDYPTGAIGDDGRNRVLIMVAVKNDYALVAAAAGPFREFSPDFGSGHPSGANFFLALDMAKYVNSFSWRGDPPR